MFFKTSYILLGWIDNEFLTFIFLLIRFHAQAHRFKFDESARESMRVAESESLVNSRRHFARALVQI